MNEQDFIFDKLSQISELIENAEETETRFRIDVDSQIQKFKSIFELARNDFEKQAKKAKLLPGNEIKCEAGCSFCCYYTVSLRAHEVVQVLSHIFKTFSKSEILEIQNRAHKNIKLMKKLSHDEIEHTNLQCALLSDEGLCRCYEVRPLNCRRNNSCNPDLCKKFHEDPSADLISDSATDVEQNVDMITYALSEAFLHNGYDDGMYYLNNALYYGLKNPRVLKRWLKKQKTFPRKAESKEFD